MMRIDKPRRMIKPFMLLCALFTSLTACLCGCTAGKSRDDPVMHKKVEELIEMELPSDMPVNNYKINEGDIFYFEFTVVYPHADFKRYIKNLEEPLRTDYVNRYTIRSTYTIVFLEHDDSGNEIIRFRNYRRSLNYEILREEVV